MKRICIDTRMWGVKHTGIGRYIENLIDYLPDDSGSEVVLIVSPETVSEPKLAKYKKYVARKYFYSFGSLLEMFGLLIRIRPSVLHVPHINAPFFWPGKMIVTVHDLIKHHSTGTATSTHGPLGYWLKQLQYLAMVWAVVHRADSIITPTHYWKTELIKKYGLDPDKITVTYEGVNKSFTKIANTKSPLPKPYLLYVGNLYPHKDVTTLIKAAEQLKMAVAIVCARSVFESRLPKSEYVHYLGRLTDAELVAAYHHATAFVFPSLIEGFGLPGLEAMAAGCPVIAAAASCLPEVYQDAALFFEPQNSTDLARKIDQVRTDPGLRKSLIAKGHDQVSKYSWATMAQATWQIYQTV